MVRAQKTLKTLPCHVAFLFQGGGALAAYQGGVYQAFEEAGVMPHWLCGISMGAINAAIIAGNAPKKRLQKLIAFWQEISQNLVPDVWGAMGDQSRVIFNQLSAQQAIWLGVHHFFKPRPGGIFYPPGTMEAISFYDTRPLRDTLLRYVDFDRINHNVGGVRLTVGAVNVEKGDSICFDTQTHTIEPEHIMASAALPPAFPPIKVGGGYYWDGGVVSNTPLTWILEDHHTNKLRHNLLLVQVDLWSRNGHLPHNIFDVLTRQKEIQYTSRTRLVTHQFKHTQKLRCLLNEILETVPKKHLAPLEKRIQELLPPARRYNLLHLIYRSQDYELHSKDYNFSHLAIHERWKRGYEDAQTALCHKQIFNFPAEGHDFNIYNFQEDGLTS